MAWQDPYDPYGREPYGQQPGSSPYGQPGQAPGWQDPYAQYGADTGLADPYAQYGQYVPVPVPAPVSNGADRRRARSPTSPPRCSPAASG